MYLLWFMLLVIMIGTITKAVIKRPFEESLIVGLLSIICCLQLSYMADILLYFVRFLQVLIPLVFIIIVVLAIKKKSVLQEGKELFGIPFASYTFYLVLVFFITKGNKVMFGDELLYWASLPKVLFYFDGKLQLKQLFQVFCVDYIPGMPLYSYFLQLLNGSFDEGLLFFGYAALSGALILPALKDRKKWYQVFLNVVILYFLPLVFFNTRANDYAVFYQSLYIDPIMGIAVAAMVWMLMYRPWEDNYLWVRYVLLSVFVTILKSSGIAFALVSGFILTIYLILRDRQHLRKLRYWVGLILPVTFWGSWQLLIRHYQLNNTVPYSPVSIFDASYINIFADFLKNKTILNPFFGSFESICTSLGVVLLLALLSLVLYLEIKKERTEETHQGFCFMLFNAYVQMTVFIIGLYGLCVGSWKGKLSSCERYISTIFEMLICILVFVIINEGKNIFKAKTIINVAGIIVGIMTVVILAPLNSPNLSRGNVYPMYMYEDYDAIIESLKDMDIGNGSAETIMLLVDEDPLYSEDRQWIKGWYGHLRNMLAFSMIEDKLRCEVKSGFTSEMNIDNLDENRLRLSLIDGGWKKTDYILWLHGQYTETPINTWGLYHVDSSDGNEALITLVFEDGKDM